MPVAGSSVWLLEVAFTFSIAGSDSASPTVTEIPAVAIPVRVVWLAIVAIVGGVFWELPPGTLNAIRNLHKATSAAVMNPLLLLSARKFDPSTWSPIRNFSVATSAAVTIPLPFVSPSRTRKFTIAFPAAPPPVGTIFVTAIVNACALLTPLRLIKSVLLAAVVLTTLATPAVTAALAEAMGISKVRTSVTPLASCLHSMPPPPVCGNGMS